MVLNNRIVAWNCSLDLSVLRSNRDKWFLLASLHVTSMSWQLTFHPFCGGAWLVWRCCLHGVVLCRQPSGALGRTPSLGQAWRVFWSCLADRLSEVAWMVGLMVRHRALPATTVWQLIQKPGLIGKHEGKPGAQGGCVCVCSDVLTQHLGGWQRRVCVSWECVHFHRPSFTGSGDERCRCGMQASEAAQVKNGFYSCLET